MASISGSVPIFKMKNLFCFYIFVSLLIFSSILLAMSEDEYAQWAAENYRLLHKSQDDHDALSRKSQEFLDRLTEQQKQEYIQLARRILEDPELAKRISKKIVEQLTKMGYKVNVGSESEGGNLYIYGERKQ